jgi:DNA invertase Pin-like site-specific DNA recombinase
MTRKQRGEARRLGLEIARSEGKRIGRPPGATGPRIAVDVAGILDLRTQGLSIRAIAALTGLSVGTVSRAVGNS